MKMKILQIGAGSMGSRRLRDLSARDDVELSLFDLSPVRSEKARKKFGVRTYGSFSEALDSNPSAFIISTPPDNHTEYIDAAINRKINFFSEADIWTNDYFKIVKGIKDNGIIGAPSSSLKLLPIIKQLKKVVDEEIGKLYAYEMNLSINLPSWHPDEGPEYYARQRKTSGGREMVTFELGYLNYIFGKPVSVSGVVRKYSGPEKPYEDMWRLQMELENGGTGHFTMLAECPERTRKGWLTGSNGIARFDIQTGELEYKVAGMESFLYLKLGAVGDILEEVYKEEINLFVDAVLGKKEYYFSYDENVVCTAALAAAERSACFGTVEKVDIEKQPALYPDSY
jgi:Predicted dehydrogenases and related proteins